MDYKQKYLKYKEKYLMLKDSQNEYIIKGGDKENYIKQTKLYRLNKIYTPKTNQDMVLNEEEKKRKEIFETPIKLKDILTIYICPNHNEKYNKRKIHMDQLLTKHGFTNFIHYKSSTEKYPLCLNNATIDIFSKYKPPFLLLEDDIDCDIDTFPEEIDIPDTTDAFYLGLSCGGGHQTYNYDEEDSSFIQISNSIVKIRNMLSAHAVIYINQKYIIPNIEY